MSRNPASAPPLRRCGSMTRSGHGRRRPRSARWSDEMTSRVGGPHSTPRAGRRGSALARSAASASGMATVPTNLELGFLRQRNQFAGLDQRQVSGAGPTRPRRATGKRREAIQRKASGGVRSKCVPAGLPLRRLAESGQVAGADDVWQFCGQWRRQPPRVRGRASRAKWLAPGRSGAHRAGRAGFGRPGRARRGPDWRSDRREWPASHARVLRFAGPVHPGHGTLPWTNVDRPRRVISRLRNIPVRGLRSGSYRRMSKCSWQ